MATVYKNRVLFGSKGKNTFVFRNDAGGRLDFEQLPNVDVKIVRGDRLANYVAYSVKVCDFDEVRVTSLPKLIKGISEAGAKRIIYEFHTSTEKVIEAEIKECELSSVSEFWVPSAYLKEVVLQLLPVVYRNRVFIKPNIVNNNIFSRMPCVEDGRVFGGTPLLWVGRFDKGKNPKDFLRILSLLPTEYVGVFVVSLEGESERTDDFLSEAFTYGVSDRIRLFMNLSSEEMGRLCRQIKNCKGLYCSTSLGESFGYSVAECLSSGLSVVAYDVGAIGEFENDNLHLIDVGDMCEFANKIKMLA
ncbi:group 1 glycosyl transferase [Alcaligenes faecalis subsp. faecalis NCIB 8687]|nr:group 1 glycosyl transferase [Alcaligenes faecalis subsp. faecalis NCIB 8687]